MNRCTATVCIATILGLAASLALAGGGKQLTLQDIFDSTQFDGKRISNIQWHPNSSRFNYTRENQESGQSDIYEQEVSTGAETVIIAGADLKYEGQSVGMSGYSRSADGKSFLIRGTQQQIWRHSRQSPYYVYELATSALTGIADGNPRLRYAQLSPDGRSVGFVRDHNLYVQDLASGKTIAVTTDGTENVLNGEFDWVYEEEFGLANAWRWSPDGRKIAFWRLDQTRLKEFTLVNELSVYNTTFKLKYPKAGEQNSIVRIGVADLESGKTTWVDLGAEEDIYIPRIYWTNSSKTLAVMRLNRLQNHLELLMADSGSGQSHKVIEDKNSTWIDVDNSILFLTKKDQIVWLSERSGYQHAYLYDYDGKLLHPLTTGDWEISSLLGADEAGKWLYFTGKKDTPVEQHVYRVKLTGKNLQRISQRRGWHDGTFSPNFKYVVGNFSDIRTPTQTMLRKTDGKLIRFLEKNEIPALWDYDLPYPEFTSFQTSDGVTLNAYMIKPVDFDPAGKYPVIVYGYGGPGSQMVVNRWGTGSRPYHYKQRILWQQMLTQRGFIIFCLDNRGTGGRGKAFEELVYGDVGKWVVHDHVEGAKYLQSLPYVDAERIGFWGWSGGGYLALMLMTQAADYFKVGISVAPVSDFHFYDTIWTERYMGLPQENSAGYAAANVLTYIDRLKGKLMIVHGTGDDNVHVQNTLTVVNELQKRGLPFDMMLYPNKNHRISGGKTQLHLFSKMTNYFSDNL